MCKCRIGLIKLVSSILRKLPLKRPQKAKESPPNQSFFSWVSGERWGRGEMCCCVEVWDVQMKSGRNLREKQLEAIFVSPSADGCSQVGTLV